MGRLAVTAVLDKDYPLIQGVVLVSALGYVLTNLLVDLSYSASISHPPPGRGRGVMLAA